jgi:hypothetical protein
MSFRREHRVKPVAGVRPVERVRSGVGGFLSILVITAIPSCYATETVSAKDFRELGSALTDTRKLASSRGGHALLEANTLVHTSGLDWHRAGGLLVSDEGLYVEKGIPGESVEVAYVTGLTPQDVQLLMDLAPDRAHVEKPDRWNRSKYSLVVPTREDLLPWVTRFVARQRELGGSRGFGTLRPPRIPHGMGGSPEHARSSFRRMS